MEFIGVRIIFKKYKIDGRPNGYLNYSMQIWFWQFLNALDAESDRYELCLSKIGMTNGSKIRVVILLSLLNGMREWSKPLAEEMLEKCLDAYCVTF